MRLLFIYFYERKATFEKGTLISFSKKYNIAKDIEISNRKHNFNINLSLNKNFQDDFYSPRNDIGVLIGENGTGKSILINAIRDIKNDYSIIVYENDGAFYFMNHVHKNININIDGVDKEAKKVDNNFEYIYYSSILDTSENDIKSDYNISNRALLNSYDDLPFNNRLSLIENDDIHKYFNMANEDALNVDNMRKVEKVKVYYSKTYFKEVEDELFQNYNKELIESIINIINTEAERNKIFIFKLLKNIQNSFKKEVLSEYYNHFQNISNIFLYNQKLIDIHFENITKLKKSKLNQYDSIINAFCVDIETIEDYKVIQKALERNFYNEELFHSDIVYMNSIDRNLEFELKSIFGDLYNFIMKNFHAYVFSEVAENNADRYKELMDKFESDEINSNDEGIYLKSMQIILEKLVNKIYDEVSNNTQNKKIVEKVFKSNISILLKIFMLNNDNVNKLRFEDIDDDLYDLLLFESIKFNHLDSAYLFQKLTVSDENIKKYIYKNIKNIMISMDRFSININANIIKLLFILEFQEFPILQSLDFLISRLFSVLNMTISLCNDINEYINFNIEENKNLNTITQDIINHFKLNKKTIDDDIYHGWGVSVEKQNSIFEINSSFFKFYKFITKDKVKPFTYEIEPPFSSGEKAKLILFARINDAIKRIKSTKENQNILILLDEADLKLHLEWQRKFVNDLIEFLNKYSDNKFYILYATHSPMILSDITDDRVVFLEKDKETAFSNDKQKLLDNDTFLIKSTFGANIYDIYNDSFFMDSFMGSFAEQKINQVIDIVNLYKIIKEKNEIDIKEKFINSYNDFFHKDVDTQNINQVLEDTQLQKLKTTIQSIGEPMLRNKLLNDIKYLFDEEIDIDTIVEELKGKSNSCIMKKLKNYSQAEQNEILKKLYLEGTDD